ncbi:MAG: hypothetical protein F4229_05730, partial [Gammaproteobacteria bacterium]|nr:hypothetical protein [Gammaproteobacteria bacterium]
MPPDFEPTQAYAKLSPEARLVAQVYGVAYPDAMSADLVAGLLRRAQIPLNGRWLTAKTVREANRELIDAELVDRYYGQEVVAYDHRALEFTLAAHQEGHLPQLTEHFKRPRQYAYANTGPSKHTQLRWCAATGDFHGIEALRVNQPDDWRFLGQPLGIPILARIPTQHIESALAGVLAEIIDTLRNPDAAVAACRKLTSEPDRHVAELAFIDLLKGQLDDACARFYDLPAEVQERKHVITAQASVQAMAATLRGDDEAASRCIEAALAAERVGTRKRNVFPPHRAFPLALLSWVRSQDLAPAGELDRLVRISESLTKHQNLRSVVASATAARLRRHQRYHSGHSGSAMDEFCTVLRFAWHTGGPTYGYGPDDPEALADWAGGNGYAWVAAECRSALHRQPDAFGDAAARLAASRAGALHRQLGTQSLCTAGDPLPVWEYSLKALEDFAAKKRKATGAGAGKRRRLVWSVEGTDRDGPPTILPREQSLAKTGKWTKGRAVPLWRLRDDAQSMDWLTDQDRVVIAAFDKYSRWERSEYAVGWSAVHALADHPRLVRGSRAVKVVRREPELVIEEASDGGAKVRMKPHLGDSTEHYRGEVVDFARFDVWRFSESHRKLLDIIPAEGLSLPEGARARFFEAVSALAGDVQVQSAAGDESGAPQVEADPRPWLQLEPSGDGLMADMLVEPVADSTIYLTPGVGGTTVFAVRDNATVRAQRDLAAERAAAEALISACPMLRGIDAGEVGDWCLALADPEDCLTLLEQLKAAEARCLWPKGETFKIVGRANSASLNLSIKKAADWFSASGEVRFDEREALSLSQIFALLDENPGSRFLKMG